MPKKTKPKQQSKPKKKTKDKPQSPSPEYEDVEKMIMRKVKKKKT